MAVVIRMARVGSKNRPVYKIVAAHHRFAAKKRFLDKIGYYNPAREEELVLDSEKLKKWIACGAQMTDAVKKLARRAGAQKSA